MGPEPESRFYWVVMGTENSGREKKKKKRKPWCLQGLGSRFTWEDRAAPVRSRALPCGELLSTPPLSLLGVKALYLWKVLDFPRMLSLQNT